MTSCIIINTLVYTSLVLMSIHITPSLFTPRYIGKSFFLFLLGSCIKSNADKLTDRHTNLHWEKYGRTGWWSGTCVDVNFLWQLPCVTCQSLLLLVDLLWDVTHRWVLNRQKFSWNLKGLCAVYKAIQVRHENVILYLNKKSREILSLREGVNNATRKTQAAISYAIRSCDR